MATGWVPFAELPVVPGTEEHHAWDVWGRDDELGALNLVGPEQVRAACGLVRSGTVVPLNLPLDEPKPGLFPSREPFRHVVTASRTGRDDRVDGLYLQGSSQWDGLRHIRFREFGYWGGRQEDDLDGSGVLGIDRWAEHGMLGRGVLVDLPGHLGPDLAPDQRLGVGPELIEEILAAQGVQLRRGDFLVLRTGWLEWFRGLPEAERAELVGTVGHPEHPLACPGLAAGRDTAAYLWDRGVVAVAADNPAMEALPVQRDVGFLHRRLIALLGLAVGEFWLLDTLAATCRAQGSYEFLLTSGVLPLPSGVGSPSNACAVL
ncbi:cyclase family protein [Pseudonocardia lacus]|uniref:cyclase family protein n=1 Tax=Pseudonocardia lacus TaxID=2835865 RepID=UPI001BDBE40B|nr:cyclase family protein [Pseudonocardia lacus]